MKKLLFIIVLFLAGNIAAQEEFSFQLFFEDALGNKDTLTLGYDPLATDTIDTAFGEVNLLNQPWGNGLDVRVGDLTYRDDYVVNNQLTWLTPNTYLTKKQILNSYCDKGFDKSARVSISFKLNNLPVNMSWGNRDIFLNNECIFTSSFYTGSYDLGPANLDAGMPRLQPSVMAITTASTSINWNQGGQNIDKLYFYNDITHQPILTPIPTYINNGDTIGVIQFVFWQKDTSTANTEKLEALSNIQIFPNPAINIVTIDLSEEMSNPIELFVYQLDGSLIIKQALLSNSNTISVSEWDKGVYFFKITDSKGEMTIKKIIKN